MQRLVRRNGGKLTDPADPSVLVDPDTETRMIIVRPMEVTSILEVEGQLGPALQVPIALSEQDTTPGSVVNLGL